MIITTLSPVVEDNEDITTCTTTTAALATTTGSTQSGVRNLVGNIIHWAKILLTHSSVYIQINNEEHIYQLKMVNQVTDFEEVTKDKTLGISCSICGRLPYIWTLYHCCITQED